MKRLLLLSLLPVVGCTAVPTGGASSVVDAPPGLPDALKSDAFAYYGLGNTKPTRYEVVQGEGGVPTSAVRTFVPGKIEGDKATYTLKQSGGLEREGDIVLSLERDGIYAMSSSKNQIKPHSLEMPAKLEVGGGWKDHTEMMDGGIKLDSDLKIAGKERVATPGGTFDDALHVTSTGGGTYGGQQVDLKTESWYVRGLGAVKQIVTSTPKGGPASTFVIQLAKPEGEKRP